jgi:hypothetical protein
MNAKRPTIKIDNKEVELLTEDQIEYLMTNFTILFYNDDGSPSVVSMPVDDYLEYQKLQEELTKFIDGNKINENK